MPTCYYFGVCNLAICKAAIAIKLLMNNKLCIYYFYNRKMNNVTIGYNQLALTLVNVDGTQNDKKHGLLYVNIRLHKMSLKAKHCEICDHSI